MDSFSNIFTFFIFSFYFFTPRDAVEAKMQNNCLPEEFFQGEVRQVCEGPGFEKLDVNFHTRATGEKECYYVLTKAASQKYRWCSEFCEKYHMKMQSDWFSNGPNCARYTKTPFVAAYGKKFEDMRLMCTCKKAQPKDPNAPVDPMKEAWHRYIDAASATYGSDEHKRKMQIIDEHNAQKKARTLPPSASQMKQAPPEQLEILDAFKTCFEGTKGDESTLWAKLTNALNQEMGLPPPSELEIIGEKVMKAVDPSGTLNKVVQGTSKMIDVINANLEDPMKLPKVMKQFYGVLIDDPCTQLFARSMKRSRRRLAEERRRLKQYDAVDEFSPSSTWGFSVTVSLATSVLHTSSSIGAINANCECAQWEMEKYTAKESAKAEVEGYGLRKFRKEVEFWCVAEGDNGNTCMLPASNGLCPPDTFLCKNQGFSWYWNAGRAVHLSTDLITTLGTSLASVGISVSIGLNVDITNKQCMYLPSKSFAGSVTGSWAVFSLSGGVSLRLNCADAECSLRKAKYCSTAVTMSISAGIGVNDLLKIATLGHWASGGISFSIPGSRGAPLMGFTQEQDVMDGGMCDEAEYILGPKVMESFYESTPQQELGYPFDWNCERDPDKWIKPLKLAYMKDPHQITLKGSYHFIYVAEDDDGEEHLSTSQNSDSDLMLKLRFFPISALLILLVFIIYFGYSINAKEILQLEFEESLI